MRVLNGASSARAASWMPSSSDPAAVRAAKALKEKILGNMSKRAAELLADDLEAMGPVRISEVEAAQKEILSTARRLADSGEIMLGGGGGEEFL